MKIFVLSDTHGRIDKALAVWKLLKDIDLIVHLGDTRQDAARLSSEIGREVLCIRGNNDGAWQKDEYHILDTECGKLLLTHGHHQNVKAGLQNLLYKTLEQGCCAALFGHTHLPCVMDCSGIYLVNPGSLTLPADGGQGSYAIVNTSEEEFSASIVYYTSIITTTSSASQKSAGGKPTGGYLRNLLNNSDRF